MSKSPLFKLMKSGLSLNIIHIGCVNVKNSACKIILPVFLITLCVIGSLRRDVLLVSIHTPSAKLHKSFSLNQIFYFIISNQATVCHVYYKVYQKWENSKM